MTTTQLGPFFFPDSRRAILLGLDFLGVCFAYFAFLLLVVFLAFHFHCFSIPFHCFSVISFALLRLLSNYDI